VPREGGTPQLVYGGIDESLWGNWALAEGGLYHLKYQALAGPSIIQFFDFETRRDRDVTVLAQHLWTASGAMRCGARSWSRLRATKTA
jgi:hypothetical protein